MTSKSPLSGIKALTFDVFGTTVSWREAVANALAEAARNKLAFLKSQEITPDPEVIKGLERLTTQKGSAALAAQWRASYSTFTRGFRKGEMEWKTVDDHHRDSLASLLASEPWNVLTVFTPSELQDLSLIWHRLPAHPDARPGLQALSSLGLTTATLTNANHILLHNLITFSSLPFHYLFCAEDFYAYKPSPEVYLGACKAMGLQPGEVAMVAAHLGDLDAARGIGMKTVYVEREGEEEWDEQRRREARGWVDFWVAEGEGGFGKVERGIRGV
ncbi:hydrolase-like protein [Thermochaetoides thermophila DSM 1495]|uniref:Hydrolase-like protein n=1 Tax=Chaetomium thermophilum (strain DSM 1495 / CBS 144.50 / IMI 039719) TaxID=759272 RepID=G0SDF6_CHATD|nr:hydrolase-like protein [Thermochaetoides thermophila DSM 1495]EGS18557.1 hydrolase-like protein [Thermochaetoides thermophila DSM 1495]